MRNRVARPCYRCGRLVAARTRSVEWRIGWWRTQHGECATEFRGFGPPGIKTHQARACVATIYLPMREHTPETDRENLEGS